MSVAHVASRAQLGLSAPRVQVEVHLVSGLPTFNIVGLPATAVKESKDRVRAALANTSFEWPAGRVTVNLSPADLPKEGCRYDRPIVWNSGFGRMSAACAMRFESAKSATTAPMSHTSSGLKPCSASAAWSSGPTSCGRTESLTA